jgi:hypothetical protein
MKPVGYILQSWVQSGDNILIDEFHYPLKIYDSIEDACTEACNILERKGIDKSKIYVDHDDENVHRLCYDWKDRSGYLGVDVIAIPNPVVFGVDVIAIPNPVVAKTVHNNHDTEPTQYVWLCEPFCENDDALSEPRFDTLWVFDTYSKVDKFINEFMDKLESECGLGPEEIGVDKEENGRFSTVFATSSELGDVGYFVWYKEVK